MNMNRAKANSTNKSYRPRLIGPFFVFVCFLAINFAYAATSSVNSADLSAANDSASENWEDELEDVLTPFNKNPTKLVIYNYKYPLEDSLSFSAEFTNLMGDKFLTSNGISLEAAYYFSEQSGIALNASYIKSSLTKDAIQVYQRGVNAFIYNPSVMGRLSYRFVPSYGKFTFSNSIQHFRFFLDTGLMAATVKSFTLADSVEAPGSTVYGPSFGLGFLMYLSKSFSAQLKVNHNLYGKVENPSSYRNMTMFSAGMSYLY